MVGTAALGLRHVAMDGRIVLAAISTDFAVDVRHRMLQPALALQKALLGCLNDDVAVIYGMPNERAMPVLARLGFEILGPMSRRVKVLRTARFLRGAKGIRTVARPLAPVLDLWLRLRSPETWRRRDRSTGLEAVTGFDGRFDDLWSRAVARPAAAPIGVRTSDFLNWRYAECPTQRYRTLALVRRGAGTVIGYITWYLGNDDQVQVVDYLDDGSECVLDELLAGVVTRARRQGAASVACVLRGAPGLQAGLRRSRFVRRECAARVVVRTGAMSTPASSTGWGDWYLLKGDEDDNT